MPRSPTLTARCHADGPDHGDGSVHVTGAGGNNEWGSAMSSKLAFDFTCPDGHTERQALDRDGLKRALEPYGHTLACPTCGRKFQPPREWFDCARKALAEAEPAKTSDHTESSED